MYSDDDDFEIVKVLSEGTLRSEDLIATFINAFEHLFYSERAISATQFDEWCDVIENTPHDEVAELWEDISNFTQAYGYDILSNEYDPSIISIVRL